MNGIRSTGSRVGLAALLAITALRCASDSRQYTPEQDDEAIAAIERRWDGKVGKGPIALTFCEDRAANDADDADSCQVEHVVKGGGRTVASTSEEQGGVGCGGCPFMVRTHVRVVALLPDGTAKNLKGIVAFGSAYDEDNDPYAGDWAFQVETEEGEATPIYFEGRIQDDGALLLSGLSLYDGGFSTSTDDATLSTSVAASCVRDQ